MYKREFHTCLFIFIFYQLHIHGNPKAMLQCHLLQADKLFSHSAVQILISTHHRNSF